MNPIVSIIMGSTSDLPVMEKAMQQLEDMAIPFEVNALSAHRTPEAVEQFAPLPPCPSSACPSKACSTVSTPC